MKSIAGRLSAVAPGVSHGLPTGGPDVAGGVVLSGEGLGDGEGLTVGVGDVVAVAVGEALRVVTVRSGVPEEQAPSARAEATAKTTVVVRLMDIAWHRRVPVRTAPHTWGV